MKDKILQIYLLMKEQKERARGARANISGWSDSAKNLLSALPQTEFCGYEKLTSNSKILAIFVEEEEVSSLSEGEGTVILDTTPFYGEGGGQVGDSGILSAENGGAAVIDTKKSEGVFMHSVRMEHGTLNVGDTVFCVVDSEKRYAIARNHSSVHLLQAALKKVLGNHVEQAGSFVDAERLRFDFKHFEAMTKEEIAKAEALVNEMILRALPVETVVTSAEEAKKAGATALFGEKYGSEVRMVSMGDFSCELCGGTHLENTAKAGLFRILSEQGVAAGIRRIEGVTGKNVLKLLYEKEALLADAAEVFKTTSNLVPEKAKAMKAELKEAKDKIDSLSSKLSAASLSSLFDGAVEKNGLKLVFTQIAEDADGRKTGDMIREKNDDAVAVLAQIRGGKILFNAVCGKGAVAKGAHAGNILKAISPIVGGGGGGRPDSAQSGGKNPEKLEEAKKAFFELF